MTVYFGSGGQLFHTRLSTVVDCDCGQKMDRIERTNMLACESCGEVRWLV